MFSILAMDDPFADIRRSLGLLLMAILGIVAMVSLVIVIINVIQGDREGAKKVSVWLIATAVGFVLINFLRNL